MGQAVDDRIRANAGTGRSVFQPTRLADDSYQQASRALDLIWDSVVALDLHGRITYVNRAAEELHGTTFVEIVGRTARTTLFAENKLTFNTAWRQVLATGEWRGENALETESGSERV